MSLEKKSIDHRFFSSETDAPIASCLVCNKQLLTDGGDYFIEKIFRRLPNLGLTEPVFEYALCIDCAEKMRSELSKSSLQAIERYFQDTLKLRGLPPEERRFEECMLTGEAIEDCTEFSIHAHCQGNQMLISIFPYSISNKAMDEISNLLSNETLDQLEDFKGRYFTGPPEFSEWLNPRRLLIL